MEWILGQTAGYTVSLLKTDFIFRPELQEISLLLLALTFIIIFAPTVIVMDYLSNKKLIKLQAVWWAMIIVGSSIIFFESFVVVGWILALMTAGITFVVGCFFHKNLEEEKKTKLS